MLKTVMELEAPLYLFSLLRDERGTRARNAWYQARYALCAFEPLLY